MIDRVRNVLLLAFVLTLTVTGSHRCLTLSKSKIQANTIPQTLISQQRTTERRKTKPGAERGVDTASFTGTEVLNFRRYSHTSTLLPNGKVLIAGGTTGAGGILSAELFDPATGTWTLTGSLHTARFEHTATLLPNGKVLVVGGQNGFNFTPGAELYDPTTGTWAVTGSPGSGHDQATATLLQSGKVLLVGGVQSSSSSPGAELYDPTTGAWSATGAMRFGRASHTATLLADGTVLVAGGYNPVTTPLATAEIYNPSTGTWAQVGSLTTARANHTSTLLSNGKALVAAGNNTVAGLASAELFDPNTKTWAQTTSLLGAVPFPIAALLPNGLVFVGGELYDPSSANWTFIPSNNFAFESATLLTDGRLLISGGLTGGATQGISTVNDFSTSGIAKASNLLSARSRHTATLIENGKVLVTGGFDTGFIGATETYDVTNDSWSPSGTLITTRDSHTATLLPNSQVLVAGGQGAGGVLSSAELYISSTNAWHNASALHNARSNHTATLLADGQVLVTGGAGSGNQAIASSELYDSSIDQWNDTGNVNVARSSHTATLLPNGKVLITGGENSGGPLSNCEIYDPVTGSWTLTGSLSTARKNHRATLLPNGKVLVTGGQNASQSLGSTELYDPNTGLWIGGPALNSARTGHTATLLSNGLVLVAGGSDSGGALTSLELFDPIPNVWTIVGNLGTARQQHSAALLTTGRIIITGGRNGGGTVSSNEQFNFGPGFADNTRPVISSLTSPFGQGQNLTLSGSGFVGASESSGGNTANSATNFPIVQIYRLDNSQISYFPYDPSTKKFSDSSLITAKPADFPVGPALVTVFTNGIPSVSVPTVVEVAADVSISQSAANVIGPAGNLIYTLTVTNDGPALATGITVTDMLSTSVTLVSCSSNANGFCSSSGRNPVINIPQLASGSSATILVATTLNAGIPEGTIITNQISVSANQFDPVPGNNSNFFNSTVGKSTSTSISASAATVGVNSTVTVTVTSASGIPTGNVVLTFDGIALAPQNLSQGVATFTFKPGSAGVRSLSAQYNPVVNGLFGSSSQTGTLSVAKGTATFGGTGPPTSTYGTTTVVITGTISNGSLIPSGNVSISLNGATQSAPINGSSGAFSATFSSANLVVGSYPITLVYAGDANFDGANDSSNNLVVQPATLTVTADDKSRRYGFPNPVFTAAITGFVGNDTIAVVSGTPSLFSPGPANPPGQYPIFASQGSLSAANYNFKFNQGTLTITKAILIVTADNKTRAFGDANPALTATITGFVLNDTTAVVQGTPGLSTDAARFSSVGKYPINVTQFTLRAQNYDFVFVPGVMDVTRATPFFTHLSPAAIVKYGSTPVAVSGRIEWFNDFGVGQPRGVVTVQIADNKRTAKTETETGNFSAPVSILGLPGSPLSYQVTITYGGDDTFTPVTTTSEISIIKADSAITNTTPLRLSSHSTQVAITGRVGLNPPAVAETKVRQKRGTTIGAGPVTKILPAITGTVSVTFGGTILVAQVNTRDGSFKAVFENVVLSPVASPFNVTLSYSGDNNINPSSIVIQITISDSGRVSKSETSSVQMKRKSGAQKTN